MAILIKQNRICFICGKQRCFFGTPVIKYTCNIRKVLIWSICCTLTNKHHFVSKYYCLFHCTLVFQILFQMFPLDDRQLYITSSEEGFGGRHNLASKSNDHSMAQHKFIGLSPSLLHLITKYVNQSLKKTGALLFSRSSISLFLVTALW